MRLGVDLGGTKIEGVVLDDDGKALARRRVPTPAGNYQATIDAVVALVRALEAETGMAGPVGIGIPGIVSPTTGLVKNANSTCLIGHPLDRDLERALDRPVRLENDANCFAMSEATDGAGRGARIVFGVILGTGVGGGIVVDRKVLPGRNAIAGEWGHNPLPWPQDHERPGPECYCGLRGCIETFLSGPALAAQYHAAAGSSLSAKDVVALAAGGNAIARELLGHYHQRLARALAGVINLLDPDVIVLGGGLSNIDSLYGEVPRLWNRWVFSDRVDTALRRNSHGDSSGVRGAAWLW